MAEGGALRVALLARAGDAREQLKRAITELGAVLVVEADPNEVASGMLAGTGATAVLVSVEPAVEAALDRLDDDLFTPGLNVMFDEAATTAALSGWDQARWARHLAAKLLGRDVLPPGAEPEAHQEAADHLVPGAPSTPAALADGARMADYADEISASALDVPSAERLSDALPVSTHDADALEHAPRAEPASWASPPATQAEPPTLDLDLDALEQAMVGASADAAPVDATPSTREVAPIVLDETDLVIDEAIDLSGLELIEDLEPEAPRSSGSSVSLLAAKEIDLGGFSSGDGASTSFASTADALEVEELTLTEAELAAFGDSFNLDVRVVPELPADADDDASIEMDPELAKLAASFDEKLESLDLDPALDLSDAPLEASRITAEPPPIPEFDFAEGAYADPVKPAAVALPDTSRLSLSAEDDAPLAGPVAASAAAKREFDFAALGNLELAPVDDVPAASPPAVAAAAPQLDVGHLSLSPLADAAESAADAVGTLLVLSGIGGPDAVRQLVRALPAGFPLAVLLQQNLDGGRHDRFVEQLAKISRLPVALAEAHETPPPRQVRVLPEGLSNAGALAFPRDGGVAALIAATIATGGSARACAVVVLSGADESAIEPLKAALSDGVRVLVQDPASCFDGKAATALRDAGAPSVQAGELAARLDAYFPS